MPSILVENWRHSQAVRENCIWQGERERRELFAQTIRANIRIRVSVNTQATTTTRTFARIVRVSVNGPNTSPVRQNYIPFSAFAVVEHEADWLYY